MFSLSLSFLNNQLKIDIPKGTFWGWQNFNPFHLLPTSLPQWDDFWSQMVEEEESVTASRVSLPAPPLKGRSHSWYHFVPQKDPENCHRQCLLCPTATHLWMPVKPLRLKFPTGRDTQCTVRNHSVIFLKNLY